MARILLPFLLLAGLASAQEYGEDYRLKVEVAGDTRKIAFFIPKDRKKNESLPLLVAIPDTKSKAFLEIGQWQQMGWERRFAVLSVDITTSSERGWHPSDQLEMQRDVEAVTEAIKLAFQTAAENDVTLDPTATVLTGHSGGGYLTMWLGLRRPDLFLAVCGRSIVFHKDILKRGKLDTEPPNFAMPFYLYRGELDHPRVSDQVQEAHKVLTDAGYKNVTYEVVPKMVHESKPEVFLEWYQKLLKSTAKGRADAIKIADEVKELREQHAAGRSGIGSKLKKLVEREKKGGFPGGAGAFQGEITATARKEIEKAEGLEADGAVFEAADLLKEIEKSYTGFDISKEARELRSKLMKSNSYKAAEMLVKAKELREKGLDEKAAEMLVKITESYPDTPASAEAERLLKSS
ncbi:MAG: prolyl oligopeptidase family serine peptidase [Planctomycetes bacterium]|nr:prolyl oligopeptidase family serine peptidase [Planctomycetota bacterium]